MKYFFTLIGIIFTIFVVSCSQLTDSNEDNHTFDGLYGTWVKTGYEESTTVFRKSKNLDDNQYGFIIRADGKIIERKNSGWCATPPITYANFEGEWKKQSESLLEITVRYWGGITSYRMEIVSLSSDELKISCHYDD